MNELEAVFQTLSDSLLVLDVVFYHLILSAFFTCKTSNMRYYLSLVAVYGLSLLTSHTPYPFLSVGPAFLLHCLAAWLLYDGKLWQKGLAVAAAMLGSQLITIFIEYGICALLGVSPGYFRFPTLLVTMISLLAKMFTVLLGWILFQLRRNQASAQTKLRWVILSLILPAVSFSMFVIVLDAYLLEKDGIPSEVLVYGCLLACANVANIYMIHTMAKNEKNARAASLLRQQTEIQTESILALEKNYRAQRKSVHEYKNQLQTIHDLLEQGDTSSALHYVKQLQGIHTTRILAVNSHHPIIDTILNHKYQIAKEKQIDVQIQVNDLSGVNLPADFLVVLLSNLWDNAIEACCRLPDNREIHCTLVVKKTLYLSIRNTTLPVTIVDNRIPTTKVPRHDHGFGLLRVQHILDQQGAEHAFEYRNGWFQFVAEIPLPTNSQIPVQIP